MRRSAAVFAFVLLILLVAGIYFPGLHSAFLLDDYQNLKGLAEVTGWRGVLGFALSDVSGSLGRPLPMLSFGLQHSSWPDDAVSFKAANLGLHLATGMALFLLFRAIAGLAGMSSRAGIVAFLGAAMWLLAPLQVSAVLYVVQRMTLLSAFFCVLGLGAWVHGRCLLSEGGPRGWLWVTAGLVLGGGLATLSKETGALLPLYILVLEETLFARLPAPPRWGAWKALFLWLPLAALVAMLAARYGTWIAPGYGLRDFTLAERLLTEPRVMLDYLRMAVAPNPFELGLFHDDFPVSRGWLEPSGTLVAVVLLLTLTVVALGARKRYSAFSFGILWFLGGHLLEGSVLPLEPYFEHRNYLPLAGLYFAVALLAVSLWHKASGIGARRALGGMGLVWLVAMGSITWYECRLWGAPTLQAVLWAERHPSSLRARERLGAMWAMRGEYGRAAEVFSRLARAGYGAGYVQWWQVGCYDGSVTLPSAGEVANHLSSARFSNGPVAALEQLVRLREEGRCGRLDGTGVVRVFAALLGNPAFSSRREPLYGLLGRWQAADGHVDESLAAWGQAFALRPSPDTALYMAYLAAGQGRAAEASRYLAMAQGAATGPLAQRYKEEFTQMEQLLTGMAR